MARENQSPITQKDVDSFIRGAIKTPADLGRNLKVDRIGTETFDHNFSFENLRDFMARGLCLELQKELRTPVQTIKTRDISKLTEAIKAGKDPIVSLTELGYSAETIKRIFTK